jgi:hypothetical protein
MIPNPDRLISANFASALAIELRRGDEDDSRDYLRIKFKNGTADGDFQVIHPFGRNTDIPLAEFIYRTQVCAIHLHAHSTLLTLPAAIPDRQQRPVEAGLLHRLHR